MEEIFEKQIDTMIEKIVDTEILLYETDLQQMLILQVWWFGVLDYHSPHQVDKRFHLFDIDPTQTCIHRQ